MFLALTFCGGRDSFCVHWDGWIGKEDYVTEANHGFQRRAVNSNNGACCFGTWAASFNVRVDFDFKYLKVLCISWSKSLD